MLVLGVELSAPASERLSSITGIVRNTWTREWGDNVVLLDIFTPCAEYCGVDIYNVHSEHAVGSLVLSLVQSH